MLSAVILLGLACGSPSYVHGASLDDSFMAPEVRISAREDFIRALSLPYIGCRPDAFPNLRIAGFCSDVTNLDAICSGLEVSVAASACSQVQGSFCCYISIAQGNTLNPVSSTIQVPTTRVSTVVSTVPSSVATTVASTAGTNTQNPTSVPATTASAFTQTSTATAETSRPGGSSTSVTVTGTASVNTGATTAATTPVSGTTTTAQNPAATTSVSTTRAPTPTSAPTQPPTQTPTQPPTAAPTQPLTPAPTAVSTPATTTTTTTNPVSPDCVNSLNPACPNVKQQILDLLNAERRAQGAADMLKLVWDDRAAQVAQQWADGCSYLHGPEDPNRPTSTFSTSGQNIGRGYTQWGDLINDWNSEKRFVTVGQACPTPSPTLQTGHWTQNVWSKTWQVGCGFHALCPANPAVGANQPQNFLVCNFGPAGNRRLFSGTDADICKMLFTPGTPANGGVCGKCGGQGSATCPDGLCNNACRFQNNFDNPTCDSLVPANNPTFCQNTNDQIVAGCQATCNCRAQGLIY